MRTALLRGLPAMLLSVLSLTISPPAQAAETVPLVEAVARLPLATESRHGYTREAFVRREVALFERNRPSEEEHRALL
ncbi:hypothetical protein [Streptomyces massasporeus]|uniref:hypothetical protein n=1 Tax=Streptomyces massasporeus TaxID=67324 RepID=UPI0033D366C1